MVGGACAWALGVHVIIEGRTVNNEPITVQVLYIGLAHAFYVNKDKGVAGYGSVNTESGWSWTEDSTILDNVARAIQVYQNEIPAEFVVLPVHK